MSVALGPFVSSFGRCPPTDHIGSFWNPRSTTSRILFGEGQPRAEELGVVAEFVSACVLHDVRTFVALVETPRDWRRAFERLSPA